MKTIGTGTGMRALLSGIFLFAFLLNGCCNPACRPENLPKSSRLSTPDDAAHFFRYTLRHRCYKLAYEALSRASRKKISYAAFRLFGPGKQYRDTDYKILDLITKAEILNILRHEDRRTATVFLNYQEYFERVLLVFERGKWKIGIVESVEAGYFQ
jgi:hypothetical protein